MNVKRLLSLGLFLCICVGLVGCSGFSEKEMKDLKEKEQLIININDDISMIIFHVDMIICDIYDNEGKYTMEDVKENEKLLKKYEEQLSKYNIDKFKKYHEYRVENKNTTQVNEDEAFEILEDRYNFAVRQLKYCEELLSYFDDENITKDEYFTRGDIYFLANYPIHNDKMQEERKELVELQKKLDEKYGTNSEGSDEHKNNFFEQK